jgi:activator of 2-hydroxyglutaryl-CoA dehydratase
MICVGIDVGSRTIKAVVMEGNSFTVLASGVVDQDVEQESLSLRLCERLLKEKKLGWKNVKRTVATGCGRNLITFADTTITEITCHAHGVRYHAPDAMIL